MQLDLLTAIYNIDFFISNTCLSSNKHVTLFCLVEYFINSFPLPFTKPLLLSYSN